MGEKRTLASRPDGAELEFTILMFCVLAPMAYYAMRKIMALAG